MNVIGSSCRSAEVAHRPPGKAPGAGGRLRPVRVACLVGALGHGTLGVLAFWCRRAYGPLVKATEDSYVGSLVEDRLRGTAYGVKHAVNGVGDLISSGGRLPLVPLGPPAGAVVRRDPRLVATAALLVLRPEAIPRTGDLEIGRNMAFRTN